jgi:hypothetical protein
VQVCVSPSACARVIPPDPRADRAAAAVLISIMNIHERGAVEHLSTAARALQLYQPRHAIASTENPNFDPAAFVAGAYGRPTVYMMPASYGTAR